MKRYLLMVVIIAVLLTLLTITAAFISYRYSKEDASPSLVGVEDLSSEASKVSTDARSPVTTANISKYETVNRVSESKQLPPEISSIQFLNPDGSPIQAKDGWYVLPSNCTIKVNVEGAATQVDFILTPTGTETYLLQKLIGSAVVLEKSAIIEWKVPDDLMGHFWVLAYNGPIARKSGDINVISQKAAQ